MLKTLVDPKARIAVDRCNLANRIKPDIVGACMRIENVPKYTGFGPTFYSLKDSKGKVFREGITKRKVSSRVNEYKKQSWFATVDQVCVQPFNDSESLRMYERARVNCDCPPFNKRLKTNCP